LNEKAIFPQVPFDTVTESLPPADEAFQIESIPPKVWETILVKVLANVSVTVPISAPELDQQSV